MEKKWFKQIFQKSLKILKMTMFAVLVFLFGSGIVQCMN